MSKRLDFCIDFRQISDQNQENLGKGDKKGTKRNKWRKITTLRAFATGVRELKIRIRENMSQRRYFQNE